MQNPLPDLLRFALVVSLSDREKFVNQVAGIIEDFEQDPEKAENYARLLMNYLNNMKENMNRERTIKKAISNSELPDNEHVEQLTKAIRELTEELQKRDG